MAFSAPSFKPGMALTGERRINETGFGVSYRAGVGRGLGHPPQHIGVLARATFDAAAGIKTRRALSVVESIDDSDEEQQQQQGASPVKRFTDDPAVFSVAAQEERAAKKAKPSAPVPPSASTEDDDDAMTMGTAVRCALIYAEAALNVLKKHALPCPRHPSRMALEAQAKVVGQLMALAAWEDATSGLLPADDRACHCFECS